MSRPVSCSLPGCRWVPFGSRLGGYYVAQGWRLVTTDGYRYAEIVKNYATRTFGAPGVRFRKGKIRFVGLFPTWTLYGVEHGGRTRYLDAPSTRNAAMRYAEDLFRARATERWSLLCGVSVAAMAAFWGPR